MSWPETNDHFLYVCGIIIRAITVCIHVCYHWCNRTTIAIVSINSCTFYSFQTLSFHGNAYMVLQQS